MHLARWSRELNQKPSDCQTSDNKAPELLIYWYCLFFNSFNSVVYAATLAGVPGVEAQVLKTRGSEPSYPTPLGVYTVRHEGAGLLSDILRMPLPSPLVDIEHSKSLLILPTLLPWQQDSPSRILKSVTTGSPHGVGETLECDWMAQGWWKNHGGIELIPFVSGGTWDTIDHTWPLSASQSFTCY